MKILIVDDEPLSLEMTTSVVKKLLPDADIESYMDHTKAIESMKNKKADIAFLDIQLIGITGLEVALTLCEINPYTNIIFTTGYSEYKSEALDMHASGYILKPIDEESVKKELQFLRYPINEKKIYVKTFGNFSISYNDKPIKFKYDKSKELIAYLIDRKGALVTNGEIMATLWEDDDHTSYLKRLKQDILDTFSKIDFSEAIFSERGKIAINPKYLDCDYYKLLNGENINFTGEYMNQYSWSEETNAFLGNIYL